MDPYKHWLYLIFGAISEYWPITLFLFFFAISFRAFKLLFRDKNGRTRVVDWLRSKGYENRYRSLVRHALNYCDSKLTRDMPKCW